MTPQPSPLATSPTPMNSRSEELRSAALRYAGRGWPVLPLKPESKIPITAHGLHDARTDPKIITDWWDAYPLANIGLRTGVAFDVLDLDGIEGLRDFQLLQVQHNIEYRHAGPISTTGRGWHLLFAPSGFSNRARIRDTKIDFRGDGGYIVAPPSLHPTGRYYEWTRPDDTEPPDIPTWIQDFLRREINWEATTVVQEHNTLAELHAIGYQDRKHGRVHVGRCVFPWHPDDDTPSLVFYPHNDTFYCFGCRAWGDGGNIRYYLTHQKLHVNDP